MCSAVDNAQVPSQTQNHAVLPASGLAKPNSQAPAIGHFNLFSSWMRRWSLCSAHSRLGCTQCSPKSPVCQEYFQTILDVSDSILEVISQSLNCISTLLNYLQSSCVIKYTSKYTSLQSTIIQLDDARSFISVANLLLTFPSIHISHPNTCTVECFLIFTVIVCKLFKQVCSLSLILKK